jgi:hypothetical protein
MDFKNKKEYLINIIQTISKEYECSELNKFELDQLEAIKYSLSAGFNKHFINKNKLYNYNLLDIYRIILIGLY